MATKTDGRGEGKKTEKTREGKSGEEIRDNIIRDINRKIGELDLGSPDEEMMKNFEALLAVLPEGKLKEMASRLEEPLEFSSKIGALPSRGQDALWRLVRPMLMVEAPWLGLIPGDINSKLQAGVIRAIGKFQLRSLKTMVAVGEKVKEIKNRGGSAEEMVEAATELAEPEEAIDEILD